MRFTPQVRELGWMLARPIAHRGLHGLSKGIVENTASAFAAAMARDFSIECDVQLTSDGEAVVFHDDTLERLITQSGEIIAFTTQQLRQLQFKGGRDRIQSLTELLQQVRGRVPLVIEIKSHWNNDPRLAQRTLDVIHNYSGPLALMSFDPFVLKVLAEHAPRVTRGIVADRVYDPYYEPLSISRRNELRSFSHLAYTKPHFVSFDYAALPFAPVQMIRAQGLPVITWTIKSEAAASRARRYSDQITFEGYQPS